MQQNINNSILLKYYPFLFLLITLSLGFYGVRDKSLKNVIWSDSEGYYLYLPAVFIYHGFEGIPYRTKIQFSNYPGTEKLFTKYTCGVAMMEAPFFLTAHYFARRHEGVEADGFGAYYRYALLAAGAFYAFLGIFFLKKVLDDYFPQGIGLLTIASLFFGTSLYYYTLGEPGTSHVFLFFLFALFLYLTPRFYRSPTLLFFAGMGFLSGLIVLIRPTNILLLIFLFLYDVNSWKGLQDRVVWWIGQWKKWWIIPLCAFLVFIPQFMYWKYISGQYILYSYGDEGFIHWNNPKLMHVLFDITNGWLLFSPVAIFALAGIFPGLCRMKYNIPVIALITGIALYAFSSWWMWWFGGGFGYRPMVEFYTLLAIPFAYFATLIYQGRSAMKKVVFTLCLALMIYYTQGLIKYKDGPHYDWRTWYQTVNRITPYWEIRFY